MKIPFLPIKVNTLHTLTNLHDNNVLVVDTMPLGIIAQLHMEYIALGKNKTKLINNYKLDMPIIFWPFKKLIIKVIKKWNATNWDEDLPVKIRRQLALNHGFRDFYGVQKGKKTDPLSIKLPLPRLKDSVLNDK